MAKRCDLCGVQDDTVRTVESSAPDRSTGHVDDRDLCDECERGVLGLPPADDDDCREAQDNTPSLGPFDAGDPALDFDEARDFARDDEGD